VRGPQLEAPPNPQMGHGVNVENSVPDVLSEGLLIIFHLAAAAKAWKVNLKSVVLCSSVHIWHIYIRIYMYIYIYVCIYIYISNMYANWNELDG
jgi:hypothetical protein